MSEVVRPTLNLGLLQRNRSAPLSVPSSTTPNGTPRTESPRDISPTTPRPVNPSKVIEGRLRTSLSSGPDGLNADSSSPRRDASPIPRNLSGKIPASISGDASKTFDSLRRLSRTNSGLSQQKL